MLEVVAGVPCAAGSVSPQNRFSVTGSLSIISGGQLGGFRENSSDGGTAAGKPVRVCFAAAVGSGKCAACERSYTVSTR